MCLKLSTQHYQALLEHATKDSKLECCGYLLGYSQQNQNILNSIYPMRNAHSFPQTHFAFVPQEQLQVFHHCKSQNLQIIGIYHSHPSSPPIPSKEDLRFAYFEELSFLIISLQYGINLASYRISHNHTREERIEILGNSLR
ncbi:M67 family metallopeptidase [Helicobacter pametensis]|uniref:M67 family metallopeptidase n=1 Tax=Helicobacter pametensis TaxID=95149 RepID=UPI0004AEF5C4|nr:M67 family metallopeptidase [Helicobacter pametensis]